MLYLHIPFCKQACSYCNFHFSTNLKPRRAVLDALENELRFRRHELPSGPVPSIYFGGGTPSLLTAEELDRIFGVLVEMEYLGRQRAGAKDNGEEQTFPEITLEANPDDLDQATIDMLAASPVNRLSIGVQSFFEEDLRFMNRAHNAEEARRAIDATVAAGFHNSSIDLIYGGQTTSDEMWAENLRIAADLGVHHISSYALTVEPKTALGHQVAAGKVADTDDDKFSRHFDMLIDGLTAAGYEHYEISNFCLPGQQSRHNSGYWSGQAYLGVGPGAHSFDGQRRRRWNVANNNRYAKLWPDIDSSEAYAAADGLLYEQESLTDTDRYNEYVMTGLRRPVGIPLANLEDQFGPEKRAHFVESQRENVATGYFQPIDESAPVYALSRAGWKLADGIAADAFWV
jgi:oxygen-independent coproporphyrinogen-3 oxidase